MQQKMIFLLLLAFHSAQALFYPTITKGKAEDSIVNRQIIIPKREKIGIPITDDLFNHKVRQLLTIMQKEEHVTTQELITMVRIDNTIRMNNMIEKAPIYKNFTNLFAYKLSKLFIKKLHARLAVGMSYYSKSYNIYWGGRPRYNSMFKLIN